MSADSNSNLVDFRGLTEYDRQLKGYITNVLNDPTAGYAEKRHTHSYADIGFDDEHSTISRDSVARLAGFRNCYTRTQIANNEDVVIDTNIYDMAYIEFLGAGRIILRVTSNEGDPASKARYLKIITKNAKDNISWGTPSNIAWTGDDVQYTENGIDIVDLVTADGEHWFASVTTNFH